MKKAVKKPSNKLIVDEFDKYYRKDDLIPLKKPLQHKKVSNYHRFIEQQLPQKQTFFQSNYHFQPQKKQELRDSHYKPKNKDKNQMAHEKRCEIISGDEQVLCDVSSQNKRESNQKGKRQVVREKQGPKRPENYYQESRRDYEFYPENVQKRERKETEKAEREKRPVSAMNKKYQVQPKTKKESQSVMKKTLSSSKFKEQHRNQNSSLHRQKAELNSQYKKNTEHLKNSSIPHKQISSQYRQTIHNNLKKKTVITKPLKIQELHKAYSNHDSSKKLNSSQLLSQIRYPKEEEKLYARTKKDMRKQEEEQKECVGGKTIFFKNPKNVQREHSESSEMPEREFRHNRNNFQQIKRERAQQERERIVSRRRRPQITENEQLRREEAAIHTHTRNMREQRREREQARPQPSRNHNHNQRRQQPRPRRQGQPRRQNPRNNRNPRYQSSTSRRPDNSNNIFRLVSQTINGQLEFINNQFNMMSNIFENFSNFVNINIDAHPNYYFGYAEYSHSNDSSSDGFNSDSSDSYSSEYDYYDQQQPQGLDQEELEMIGKIRYKVSEHGSHQCTICLAELKNGDEAKKLFCDHLFHSDCIDEWLRRKSDCPVCRDKQAVQ